MTVPEPDQSVPDQSAADLAAVIAELAQKLSPGHVAAWRVATPPLSGQAVAIALETAALLVARATAYQSEVVRELGLAAKPGVQVDLILEEAADRGGTLHGQAGAAAAFASIRQDVTLWTWPAARRPGAGSSRAALHAKLVAADESIALLGSANLTDRALAHNLELGVIIRDPEVVGRIVRHFRKLKLAHPRSISR